MTKFFIGLTEMCVFLCGITYKNHIMGNASEKMIENNETQFRKKLAKYLGLSYGTFSKLDYKLDTEESNDGLIYSYVLEFSENSTKKTLDKIKGLSFNRSIIIPAHIFDNL